MSYKLQGSYTPPEYIGIIVREYNQASFLINEEYSMLNINPAVGVVDLYENDVLIHERVSVATCDRIEGEDIVVTLLKSIKEQIILDKMDIVEY
ncbi:hypothetical protein [Klebsiella pneumoniae]|uniref:hypothetical protein n=1 Tax=Klebsiella pneumoniae TaxID=573 RepID=UPI0009BB9145|nr:hypothetical protein [Klebsiella pneumoniae]SLQ65547.1 Uncharacterised protein [Klebsiella pneumoniae]HBY7762062.1 hypothetical protein [Klebsiella pneumoniae]